MNSNILSRQQQYAVITLSVMLSLAVVWAAVHGATTISTNITTDGTLTIGHSAVTSAPLYVAEANATGTPAISGITANPVAWFTSNSSLPMIGLENTSIGSSIYMTVISDSDGRHGIVGTGNTNTALSFGIDTNPAAIWITTGNNVGIGTTTPATELVVEGSATTTLNISTSASAKGGCIQLKGGNGSTYRLYINNLGSLATEAGTCK